jgi:hypothetical protein
MGDPSTLPQTMLRPLGFGEIFDRAITLFVRNFLPLAAIMLVVLVPWGIVQYIIDAGQGDQLSQIFTILQHPGSVPKTTPMPFPYSSGQIGVMIVGGLLFLALIPFALNAIVFAVGRIYVGRPIDVRACYLASLRRWAPVLGVMGMDLLIFIGWYIAVVAIAVIFGGLGAAFLSYSVAASVVLFLLLGLGILALLLLLVLMVVALSFAMYSVVLEERGPIEAIGSGFARIFNRQEMGRALLIWICSFLISVAGIFVLEIFLFLALWLHQTWLVVTISTIGNAITYSFGVVLMAVYYYDVRVRREGLDLELGLQSLGNLGGSAPA